MKSEENRPVFYTVAGDERSTKTGSSYGNTISCKKFYLEALELNFVLPEQLHIKRLDFRYPTFHESCGAVLK